MVELYAIYAHIKNDSGQPNFSAYNHNYDFITKLTIRCNGKGNSDACSHTSVGYISLFLFQTWSVVSGVPCVNVKHELAEEELDDTCS